jgi:hypothetical protein
MKRNALILSVTLNVVLSTFLALQYFRYLSLRDQCVIQEMATLSGLNDFKTLLLNTSFEERMKTINDCNNHQGYPCRNINENKLILSNSIELLLDRSARVKDIFWQNEPVETLGSP